VRYEYILVECTINKAWESRQLLVEVQDKMTHSQRNSLSMEEAWQCVANSNTVGALNANG